MTRAAAAAGVSTSCAHCRKGAGSGRRLRAPPAALSRRSAAALAGASAARRRSPRAAGCRVASPREPRPPRRSADKWRIRRRPSRGLAMDGCYSLGDDQGHGRAFVDGLPGRRQAADHAPGGPGARLLALSRFEPDPAQLRGGFSRPLADQLGHRDLDRRRDDQGDGRAPVDRLAGRGRGADHPPGRDCLARLGLLAPFEPGAPERRAGARRRLPCERRHRDADRDRDSRRGGGGEPGNAPGMAVRPGERHPAGNPSRRDQPQPGRRPRQPEPAADAGPRHSARQAPPGRRSRIGGPFPHGLRAAAAAAAPRRGRGRARKGPCSTGRNPRAAGAAGPAPRRGTAARGAGP